jgi:Lrp/AsnC family transcriptional regulator
MIMSQLSVHSTEYWDTILQMMHILDNFDRHILSHLQRDATLTVDAIGEKVGLSRNACWRRIKNLEDQGVIHQRVALVDPAKVGCALLVLVMVRTNSHDSDWLSQFRAAVTQMPEVISAHRVSGDLDYMLRVRVADVPEYDSFYQRLIKKVSIADVSASFVMEDIKDTTALPL